MRPISRDAAHLLIRRDLIKKLQQNGRVAHIAASNFHGPHFQRYFVDLDMYLEPNPAFGAAMLVGVPLAFSFALSLETGAIDEQVQRPPCAAICLIDRRFF